MGKLKDKAKRIEINPGMQLASYEDNQLFDSSYVVKVSVRQLVEFIMRTGDIDNRRVSGGEKQMQAGSRIHRMIQKSMGAEYYPEYLLRYRYLTKRFAIEIEGRADGIIDEGMTSGKKHNYTDVDNTLLEDSNNPAVTFDIALNQHLTKEDYPQITVDEIKTVAKSIEYIKEPQPVHLAQAKVYAYIYAKQNNLFTICVRMTYCHVETYEKKYFHYEYSLGELEYWFHALMSNYTRWADFQYKWYKDRQETIKNLQFPFVYREGQRQLAVYVYQTIKESKKLYLQAPTGTGKTISTVFPTVKSMGEGLTEKIFYLTAKTITRTVAEESFDILRAEGLRFKNVTITAKEKICIYEKAECNPNACKRAAGHYDRVNDAIYEVINNYDKIDRTVIEKVAEEYNVCPFELSLDISLFADGIICDYNYAFDPHASLKRYFTDGMKGDYVFLIDEAHNLLERARDMFSAVLLKEDLLAVKRLITTGLEKQTLEKTFVKPSLALRVSKALERCNREMLSLKKQCDGMTILDDIDTLAGLVESLHTVMDQFLEEEKECSIRNEVQELYFVVCHFLMIYEKLDEDYVTYAELYDNGSFMVKLFCVNPRNNLQEGMSKGRSSILFSATFLPIQYYKYLLGGEKSDYEALAKSTFDTKKRALIIAEDVTSKYSRRGPLEYGRIASYIYEITSAKKGNYMVFLPSHAFLAEVYKVFADNYFDEKTMLTLVQEDRMTEEQREEFLSYFENISDHTLIGFCVLGGIFSEGIDLKKDSLIGAIIVGNGLPMVCNEREILKDYFDDESSSGFDYAYTYPGMNKVLQAAGRVIRTREDIGVVALLDERFNMNSYKRLFPKEWDDYKIVNSRNVAACVRDFWKKQEQ